MPKGLKRAPNGSRSLWKCSPAGRRFIHREVLGKRQGAQKGDGVSNGGRGAAVLVAATHGAKLSLERWRTRHDSNVWPPPSEGGGSIVTGAYRSHPEFDKAFFINVLGAVYIHLMRRMAATRLIIAAKHLSVFS